MKPAISIFLVLTCSMAQARVFDMTKETLAGYFSFIYGPSAVGAQPFEKESQATSFSGSFTTNSGGEFGFVYVPGRVSWRFGLEFIRPSTLKELAATNSGGTKLYNLDSDFTSIAPKIGLEINFVNRSLWRAYGFGYYGSASVTIANRYYSVSIAPAVDHTVAMKGSSSTYGGGLGIEFSAVDSTTMTLEAGYRNLNYRALTFASAVTTFSGPGSGSVVAGDPVNTTEGERRTLNLNGAYFNLGFRFYLY
ncbi:MAG: hypothetical protein N2578_04715 [Bdellovibrionaceae bacterium]|nr:hypothetical protein [Pseudobdellovibrionaceae bacterium]